jgi:MerR family mercuric resistance operon transcriptional regulator
MDDCGRTIGQLAKAAGVGVETVRYYERRGLLDRPKRPSTSGYRRYGEDALRLLRYIRLGQRLGLSLKDIEGLLARSRAADESFCLAFRTTVATKLAKVREELNALQSLESELQACLTDCAHRERSLPCPILVGLGRRDVRLEEAVHP